MEFAFNMKKVANFLNVSISELTFCTLGEIQEALNLIEQEEWDNRRTSASTLQKYKRYFKSFNDFTDLFGESLTFKYVAKVPLSEFVETVHVKRGQKPHSNVYEKVGEGTWNFPVPRSRSGRTESLPSDIYEIPSKYQGLKHNEIIRGILFELYPWLEEFKLSIYELENKYDGFYIKTEKGTTFTVPYQLLLKGKVNGILIYNQDYWKTFEGKIENLENVETDLIQTTTVQTFLRYLQ